MIGGLVELVVDAAVAVFGGAVVWLVIASAREITGAAGEAAHRLRGWPA